MPNTPIEIIEENLTKLDREFRSSQKDIKSLQQSQGSLKDKHSDLENKLKDLESKLNEFAPGDDNAASSSAEMKELKASEKVLKGKYDELDARITGLFKQIENKADKGTTSIALFAQNEESRELRTALSQMKDLKESYDELTSRVDSLTKQVEKCADKGSSVVSSSVNTSDVKEIKGKYAFNTCTFLCAILVFNIVATWLIIFKPAFDNSVKISELPWFFSVILVAVMLVNIIGTVKWIMHLYEDVADYGFWKGLIEGVLLFTNIFIMWLFAFNPLQIIPGAVKTFMVFLTLANVTAIVMRILHFAYEYTSANFNIKTASLILNIFETACFAAILITIIVWVV